MLGSWLHDCVPPSSVQKNNTHWRVPVRNGHSPHTTWHTAHGTHGTSATRHDWTNWTLQPSWTSHRATLEVSFRGQPLPAGNSCLMPSSVSTVAMVMTMAQLHRGDSRGRLAYHDELHRVSTEHATGELRAVTGLVRTGSRRDYWVEAGDYRVEANLPGRCGTGPDRGGGVRPGRGETTG